MFVDHLVCRLSVWLHHQLILFQMSGVFYCGSFAPSGELFSRNKQNERLFVSDYLRVRDSCSGVKWFEVNERRGQRLINTCTSSKNSSDSQVQVWVCECYY